AKGTEEAIPKESFIFIIALGSVVAIVALLGLVGVQKRSRCMLLTYKCCGGESSKDWKTVPPSCCEKAVLVCKDPYKQGCGEAVYKMYKPYLTSMAVVSILLAIVEFAAVFGACVLSHKAKG
uniref:Tetraspanin n=1 Tax=Mesocestoides corti TaxID=53468 RepID=A0A5K3FUF5_MESCO